MTVFDPTETKYVIHVLLGATRPDGTPICGTFGPFWISKSDPTWFRWMHRTAAKMLTDAVDGDQVFVEKNTSVLNHYEIATYKTAAEQKAIEKRIDEYMAECKVEDGLLDERNG